MLTAKVIRDAKPGTGKDGKPATWTTWDTVVPGLGLQVTRGGTRNFVVRYKVGGRKRQAILCRAGGVALKDIRKRAADELLRVRSGETDPLERQREAREAVTVTDLVERFLTVEAPARIERGRMSRRTRQEYAKQSRAYVLPALGRMRVRDVKRADIERAVDPLRPIARNRTLAYLSRLFTLAEVWELREPGAGNPCRKIERSRETPRDRVLSPDEMRRLSGALKEAEGTRPVAVAAIRVAALSGLRISEVLKIRWLHVDLSTGRLLIPESKVGRRWHVLPAPAVEVMRGLPHIADNPWCFTIGRHAPLTYRTARLAFAEAAREAGISDARLHDLRRGVVSAAARSGANVAVLQQLLGHKTPQMALRYAAELADPVQQMRERVAANVASMMA